MASPQPRLSVTPVPPGDRVGHLGGQVGVSERNVSVRHEALLARTEVKDHRRLVVVAAG
jgi:hypothetical protein